MKVRQDAWTDEDDLLLAETVLRHVREGSTQLNAFEEVGDRLNRTSAACGFRWNAVVRYSYEQALQLAKKHRKDKMRAASGEQAKKRLLYTPPASDSITNYEEFVQEESIVQYKRSYSISRNYRSCYKGLYDNARCYLFFTNSRIFKYKSDSS